jgi:hypothetical protein
VKIVLTLVDFSPDSTHLKAEELKQLHFADQIELFHLGYGLWDENADKKWRCSGQPELAGVEESRSTRGNTVEVGKSVRR